MAKLERKTNQIRILRWAKGKRGMVIAEPVGTGKTIIALLIIKKYYGRGQSLVIVPSKGLKEHWEEKIDGFPEFKDLANRIIVRTRYEYTKEGKRIRVKNLRNIVIDEAHHYKPGSSTYNKMEGPRYRRCNKILLTATPFQLSKYELLNLYRLCQKNGPYIADILGGRADPIYRQWKNPAAVKQWLKNNRAEPEKLKVLLSAYDYHVRMASMSKSGIELSGHALLIKLIKKELQSVMRRYYVRIPKNNKYRKTIRIPIDEAGEFNDAYYDIYCDIKRDGNRTYITQILAEICSSKRAFQRYVNGHSSGGKGLKGRGWNEKIMIYDTDVKIRYLRDKIIKLSLLNEVRTIRKLATKGEIPYPDYKEAHPGEKVLVFCNYLKTAEAITETINTSVNEMLGEKISSLSKECRQLFVRKKGGWSIVADKNKNHDVFWYREQTPLFISDRKKKQLKRMWQPVKHGGEYLPASYLLKKYYKLCNDQANRVKEVLASSFYNIFRSRNKGNETKLRKSVIWLRMKDIIVGKNRVATYEEHQQIDEALKQVLRKLRYDPIYIYLYYLACKKYGKKAQLEKRLKYYLSMIGISGSNVIGGNIITKLLTKEREYIFNQKDSAINAANEQGKDSMEDRLGVNNYCEKYTSQHVGGKEGGRRKKTHETIRKCFNGPFNPRVLVLSPVGREGLDFQGHCRVAVHHDMAWNPAVIEQRQGRIDRYGSYYESLMKKASRKKAPKILYYKPIILHTVDQSMENRLKQRETWQDLLLNQKAKEELEIFAENQIYQLSQKQKKMLGGSLDLSPNGG